MPADGVSSLPHTVCTWHTVHDKVTHNLWYSVVFWRGYLWITFTSKPRRWLPGFTQINTVHSCLVRELPSVCAIYDHGHILMVPSLALNSSKLNQLWLDLNFGSKVFSCLNGCYWFNLGNPFLCAPSPIPVATISYVLLILKQNSTFLSTLLVRFESNREPTNILPWVA